jgi:anti-sigma factor RsiW
MTCSEVQQLLNPYIDAELDVVRHVQIDEHLAGCVPCSLQERNLRTLTGAVSSSSLRYRAPDPLRRRIAGSIAPATRTPQWPALRLTAIAAGVALLIGAAGIIVMILSRKGQSTEERLAQEVVAGHIRSLQVEHLTDVPSSDKHTVKPWFQLKAKLGFAPEVPDLSAKDYTLSGGRADYFADRPVAAIVYSRRSHVINLFTWPAANNEEREVRSFTRQGYHVRHWQQAGMAFWAVSDLNDEDMDEFVNLLRKG